MMEGPPAIPSRPDLPTQAAPEPPPRPTHRARRRVVAALLALSLVGGASGVAVWLSRPAGAPHGPHAFLAYAPDGGPFRWNPCQTIRYQVNLAGAPAGALATVRVAVRRVSAATGIAFSFEGTTDRTAEQQESLGDDGASGGPLPILIAWLPQGEFESFAGVSNAAAIGEPLTGYSDVWWEYVSGLIVVNASAPMSSGFTDRDSVGPVVMHELGHVMGLGHVGAGDELMWSPDVAGASSFPNPFQTDWGQGDREGLRLLGRAAGCIAA